MKYLTVAEVDQKLSDLAVELNAKPELTEADQWHRALLNEMRTSAVLRERLAITKRRAREKRRSLRAVVAELTSETIASWVEKPSALSWNGDVTIAAVALRVVKKIRMSADTIPNTFMERTNNDEALAMKLWINVLDEIIFALEIKSEVDPETSYTTDRTRERVDRGMAYFVENFDALWS